MRVRPFRIALVAMSMIAGLLAAGAGAPASQQSYIVVLDAGTQNVGAVASDLAQMNGGQVGFVYEHAIKGFSITTTPQAAAALARNPGVAYVETDEVVSIAAQTVPTGIQRIFADDNPNIGIDASDDFRVDVDVAVIDTGIDLDHPDLNVVASTNCSGGSPFKQSCGSGGDDDNGHGTHVAGTIGALDNDIGVVGVAPGARLWSVKVLRSDGSGYLSWIIAGIDHVTANADKIEVANMSLGGSFSNQAFDDAIANSVSAGVAYAVAAGNSDSDASGFSPANHPDVMTVSALADFDGEPGGLGSPTCRADQDDTLADFSNWGSLVDIAAPGVCILSTWLNGGYNTISGTSMASPHAAGALALLASSNNPADANDVSSLYGQVINSGNFNWTDDSGDGTKEPLLDVSDATLFSPVMVAGDGGGDGGGGDTNSPPAASFTFSCTDLACDFDGSSSSDSDGTISSYDWDFGDGSTAAGTTASHTYGEDGTYTVSLTVTDDEGATDSTSQNVSVSDGTTNTAPTASFTVTCTDLACDFDGTGSSDSDGTISSYAWDFGDGNNATGATPSHTYAADGIYTVTLTVTDDDGATDTSSQEVSVSESSSGEVTLTGSSINNGRTWTAVATVTGPEGTYSGTWDLDSSTGTCTIDSGETSCSIELGGIHKSVSSVTYTDDSDPSLSITISKP